MIGALVEDRSRCAAVNWQIEGDRPVGPAPCLLAYPGLRRGVCRPLVPCWPPLEAVVHLIALPYFDTA